MATLLAMVVLRVYLHAKNSLTLQQWNNMSLNTTTTLHLFNGIFPRTTEGSWHQKGKPFWILIKQEMMGWQ